MINVIWYDQCFGNWDHGLLDSVFSRYPELFKIHNSKRLLYADRAIIIVSGKPQAQPLRLYLETFKSGIVILTSEEDSYFDWESAIPSHLEVWTQYWVPAREAVKERLLLGAPKRINEYKINFHLPKKYLWSFVGQCQNPFRQQCVEVLKSLDGGFIQVPEFFGGLGKDGMEYQEYLDIMCQSKYVICPSGSMSVDSFRLYEAMECGAIPIADMKSPRENHIKGFNWWREVYPQNQVYCVSTWNDLDAKWFEEKYYADRLKSINWWFDYKMKLHNKLIKIANEAN